MKKSSFSLFIGMVLGAASWAVVPLASDKFEPFDNDFGFYIGQCILSVMALYLGFTGGLKHVFIFVIGVYISSNIYPYLFGSSESKAWTTLGLVTTLTLCLFPLVFGVLGKLVRIAIIKYNNWPKQDAAKRGTS